MALAPALTVVPEGVADSEKSDRNTASETVAVCPLPVPMTVMFKGFAVVGVRPVTVSVLDPPAVIELGLKVHVAPPLHDNAMDPRKLLGAEAEMLNVVVLEPMRTTLDRALEEREKTGLPVPDSESDAPPTAFDAMETLPLTLPVAAGEKLTAMVQVWLTLNEAGTVGKLVPQLLVSAKSGEAVMLVMVIGRLPLLSRSAVWGRLVVPTVCAENVSLVGVNSNDPPVRMPFPVTVIPCVTGLPSRSALSVMVISSV